MKFNLHNRLYVANHFFTQEEERELMENCDVVFQREVFNFIKSITYEEIDEVTTVMIMNNTQYNRFLNFSETTGIKYRIEDVTDKVILGELDLGQYITNVIVNPYLQNNLTVDEVLDKINVKGIDSLSDIDNEILKNFK